MQLAAARIQIKKYRDRCPVEREDVEAAGVTWARCLAVTMRERPRAHAFLVGLLGVKCSDAIDDAVLPEVPENVPSAIAGCVAYIEVMNGRDRWGILEEMAAEP